MNKDGILDVIYVLSLGHSGSTVLDYALSHHTDAVGLGEVYSVLIDKELNTEETHQVVTGNKPTSSAFVWKYKDEIIQTAKEYGPERAYELILKNVSDSGKQIIIDSSKTTWLLKILKSLHDNKKIRLHTIFLVRDMRGWAHSMIRLEKKTNLIHRPALYTMLKWFVFNVRLRMFLRSEKISYIQLGYETFCANPQKTLSYLYNVLGLNSKKFSLENTPDSQIAYGNRMKKGVGSEFRVRCDDSWVKNIEIRISSLILWPMLLLNKYNVYNRPPADKA